MKLHEYQAKEIFNKYRIKIPEGKVAFSLDDVSSIIKYFETENVVLKAQVHVGGRGKAGGIKVVNKEQAIIQARNMFGTKLKGLTINKILIEQAICIKEEYYLGITIDRSKQRIVIMVSSMGGVDIEEVAKTHPDKIIKVYIDPEIGLLDFYIREILYKVFPQEAFKDVSDFIKNLYRLFIEYDCSLAEINPLVITDNKEIIAADAKINIDDNSLFRHPDLKNLIDLDEDDPSEKKAKSAGLSYVKLDGDIGCVVNGAGLAMATMDAIKYQGGNPANFLDIGGSSNPQKVTTAMEILLTNSNLKGVLFNIFGGITRCDDVAKGLVEALENMNINIPIVVRLTGTNEKEGREILEKANIKVGSSMLDSVKQIISFVKK